ncbi:hypothetical protein [Consotaella salsifontis]|uniref:Uncharacterized protein n=1 Tax=Consotaella salsifontis TaxID=1365950 RepID=A0A1T4RW21_9HYPH|nr:hypothetical protein [Consotaella salsifontis]SKA20204.1 hypothetical protein SAMN05428963_10822 [Consotaella salsifontis]
MEENEGFFRGEMVHLVGYGGMVTGQVINERDWGCEYLVRIAGTTMEIWFRDVELMPTASPIAADAAGTIDQGNRESNNVIDLAKVRATGRA